MEKQVRVLHVLGWLEMGGAESRIMDLYRHLDREQIQFDFLIHTAKKGFFEEEVEQLGGHIYRVSRFKMYNYFSYKKALQDFFAEYREFQVVQGHMTSTAAIYLPLAKAAGIPVTVAHARSAGVDKGIKGILTRFLRKNLYKRADCLFACSALAGEAVFGKKAMEQGMVKIVPNAIDAARFQYNPEKRQEVRKALGIEKRFVVGHVGSFRYAKNHEYLLRVFSFMDEDAVLMLIGAGELMEEMKELAKSLQIEERVLFLGNKSNVEDYYQAMDYFVFPSHYEGLPGSVVEAQTSGVRCLISDAIAEETDFSPLVTRMSINQPPESWAAFVKENAQYEREGMYAAAAEHGFDVTLQAVHMAEFYKNENRSTRGEECEK